MEEEGAVLTVSQLKRQLRAAGSSPAPQIFLDGQMGRFSADGAPGRAGPQRLQFVTTSDPAAVQQDGLSLGAISFFAAGLLRGGSASPHRPGLLSDLTEFVSVVRFVGEGEGVGEGGRGHVRPIERRHRLISPLE